MIGAAGDHVPSVQRHDRRGELDELGHAMLHIVGVVVVAELAVVPEAHDQVVGLRDFVGGGYAGADWRERVERLAEPTCRLPGAPPLATRRHGDRSGVARYRP